MPDSAIQTNFYDLLCVARDASADDIRRSYRRLMQTAGHHPDLGGDAKTAALINKAYATLIDNSRRADYDRQLSILSYRFTVRSVDPTPTAPRRAVDLSRHCAFCELSHGYGTVHDADVMCDRCGSPLCAAKRLRFEPAGQRSVARTEKELSVNFFADWRQAIGFAGRTEDLSPSGMRLVSRQRLQPQQHIRIVSSTLDAVAVVTRCARRRRQWQVEYVAGVSFVTLRFAQAVGTFVSTRV